MSEINKFDEIVFLRDGTSQEQRLLPTFLPDYVKIDERELKDFFIFINKYAKLLRYYNFQNIVESDWSNFFTLFEGLENDPDGTKWKKVCKKIENGGQLPPHIALIVTFLHLFKYAQNHLNQLTERHLNYYYRDILQFEENPASSDTVHIILELSKNTDNLLVSKGTIFKAGKDALGQELYYVSNRDVLITKAQIDQLKSLVIAKKNNCITNLYAIPQSNSKDGMGEPLDIEEPWLMFSQGIGSLFNTHLLESKTGNGSLTGLIGNNGHTSMLWLNNMTIFNGNHKSNGQNNTPELSAFEKPLGFALASQLLQLAEGDREIKIRVYFEPEFIEDEKTDTTEYREKKEAAWNSFKKIPIKNNLFLLQFSTADQWLNKTVSKAEHLPDRMGFELSVLVPTSDPAIVNYNNAIYQENLPEGLPIVKIKIHNTQECQIYEQLTAYPIADIEVQVAVQGIVQLSLQNDFGIIDTSKPFEPFGPQPNQNTNFYIGCPQVFFQKIDSLSIAINWKGLPANFSNYYDEYPTLRGKKFKVALSLLYQKQWLPITENSIEPFEHTLFEKEITHENIQVNNLTIVADNVILQPESIESMHYSTPFLLNNLTEYGFLKMELIEPEHAFGHKQYSHLYTDRLTDKLFKKSAQFIGMSTSSASTPSNETIEIHLPNEPYTPTIQNIMLGYSAKTQFKPNNGIGSNKLIHLHPFGYDVIDTSRKNNYLLPTYSEEGSLYIGIENLAVPETLSFLFQLAEGSGNPDISIPIVEWHYLSNNIWQIIEQANILTDTTNQLLNSGLIILQIPKDATCSNSILPKNLYWLRISVKNNRDALNQVISITTQAISAVLVDNNNDPNHLKTPLPPDTIKELLEPDSAVKKIIQPYSSFGGKMQESGMAFYTRVSERLRHKNRCVSAWDFEHMVLSKFNSVYKVKCLNHTDAKTEISPGAVTLVIIPNLRNKNAVNPLQPKAPLNLLKEIKDYISNFISPFVQLEVQNPIYEEIKVAFEVSFKSGFDIGYHIKQTNESIKRYLSPWAYQEGKDITFGGRIHKSAIINFIEEMPYVDFISNFILIHNGRRVEEAYSTKPRSILVSAEHHIINPIKAGEERHIIPEGIGHMLIEVNLVVEKN